MAAADRLRRPPWLALAGVAQAVGIAFLPKCPLCLAMDFGVVGSFLGATQARLGSLLWPSLVLALGSAAVLAARLRKRGAANEGPAQELTPRIRPCCAPAASPAR
ncbi:MAG TPA: hypothetical protein VMR54_05230 [Thermoanaerobaculia bacterium]|nr:hypothetical protein [Thermoanaerobaculia bacterium]